METGTPFDPLKDNERVLEDEIRPLLAQIIEICKREGVPFVAVLQFNAADLATSAYLFGPHLPVLLQIIAVTCPTLLEEAMRRAAGNLAN